MILEVLEQKVSLFMTLPHGVNTLNTKRRFGEHNNDKDAQLNNNIVSRRIESNRQFNFLRQFEPEGYTLLFELRKHSLIV